MCNQQECAHRVKWQTFDKVRRLMMIKMIVLVVILAATIIPITSMADER